MRTRTAIANASCNIRNDNNILRIVGNFLVGDVDTGVVVSLDGCELWSGYVCIVLLLFVPSNIFLYDKLIYYILHIITDIIK